MRYRATLAYDGTLYQGFQRQREGIPTVQGRVEQALGRISGGAYVPITAAGRTDSGVHATGQVIAFNLDWKHETDALYRAVNANLPSSIAITELMTASAAFHPRYDAQRRQYQYTIRVAPHALPLMRYTSWVIYGYTLDVPLMQQVAAQLVGRRDFGALGTPPQGNSTVRTIHRSEWEMDEDEHGQKLRYTVEADAFLYRMVRRTVGMLYDCGRGQLSPDDVRQKLAQTEVARGVTVAPPQGLVLTRVTYADDAQPLDKKTDRAYPDS